MRKRPYSDVWTEAHTMWVTQTLPQDVANLVCVPTTGDKGNTKSKAIRCWAYRTEGEGSLASRWELKLDIKRNA